MKLLLWTGLFWVAAVQASTDRFLNHARENTKKNGWWPTFDGVRVMSVDLNDEEINFSTLDHAAAKILRPSIILLQRIVPFKHELVKEIFEGYHTCGQGGMMILSRYRISGCWTKPSGNRNFIQVCDIAVDLNKTFSVANVLFIDSNPQDKLLGVLRHYEDIIVAGRFGCDLSNLTALTSAGYLEVTGDKLPTMTSRNGIRENLILAKGPRFHFIYAAYFYSHIYGSHSPFVDVEVVSNLKRSLDGNLPKDFPHKFPRFIELSDDPQPSHNNVEEGRLIGSLTDKLSVPKNEQSTIPLYTIEKVHEKSPESGGALIRNYLRTAFRGVPEVAFIYEDHNNYIFGELQRRRPKDLIKFLLTQSPHFTIDHDKTLEGNILYRVGMILAGRGEERGSAAILMAARDVTKSQADFFANIDVNGLRTDELNALVQQFLNQHGSSLSSKDKTQPSIAIEGITNHINSSLHNAITKDKNQPSIAVEGITSHINSSLHNVIIKAVPLHDIQSPDTGILRVVSYDLHKLPYDAYLGLTDIFKRLHADVLILQGLNIETPPDKYLGDNVLKETDLDASKMICLRRACVVARQGFKLKLVYRDDGDALWSLPRLLTVGVETDIGQINVFESYGADTIPEVTPKDRLDFIRGKIKSGLLTNDYSILSYWEDPNSLFQEPTDRVATSLMPEASRFSVSLKGRSRLMGWSMNHLFLSDGLKQAFKSAFKVQIDPKFAHRIPIVVDLDTNMLKVPRILPTPEYNESTV